MTVLPGHVFYVAETYEIGKGFSVHTKKCTVTIVSPARVYFECEQSKPRDAGVDTKRRMFYPRDKPITEIRMKHVTPYRAVRYLHWRAQIDVNRAKKVLERVTADLGALTLAAGQLKNVGDSDLFVYNPEAADGGRKED